MAKREFIDNKEPTTKNDSLKYCDRNICLKNEYNNIGCENCEVTKSQNSTTKNDLGVDCIDRAELLKAMDTWDKFGYTETGCFVREPKGDYVPFVHYDDMVKCVKGMPSVTPQEPQSFKWCTDCKEYDQEKHCCHRYSKVIRDTVAEIEQEPVLDKIRAEIIEKFGESECAEECGCLYALLDIIDKYKAESEGT